MKHPEFYNRYKTNYPPMVSPLFSKRNWWRIGLITMVAILIGPLVMYKNQRSVPFSFDYYLRLTENFIMIIVPFVVFLFWINWRESIKRSRGYAWLGKFEVVNKRSTFVFCYFLLTPGDSNKLRVSRNLFEKTRVGDFILIRRDALGNIEEISKVNSFSNRIAKVGTSHFPKRTSKSIQST